MWYNTYMDHYLKAMQAIKNMLRTGRTIFPAYWDSLDFDARQRALFNSRCGGCGKIKRLTGTISLMFGTEEACSSCADENNLRLMAFREEFNVAH